MREGFFFDATGETACFTQLRDFSTINYVLTISFILISISLTLMHLDQTVFQISTHPDRMLFDWILSIHHIEAQPLCFNEAQTNPQLSLHSAGHGHITRGAEGQ